MGVLSDRGAPARVVDWAVASRTHPEQTESGDLHVVAPFASGVLLGAVDGLGHGAEAADAARGAVALLEALRGESPVELVRRCHAALVGTRGVVMSVASIDAREGTLSWLGIGNVEGLVLRAEGLAQPCRETLLLRAGVVGYRLPELHASLLRLARGDTLVFATDGIRGDFGARLLPGEPPGRMAERILAEHGSAPDDALVLVARFLGREA